MYFGEINSEVNGPSPGDYVPPPGDYVPSPGDYVPSPGDYVPSPSEAVMIVLVRVADKYMLIQKHMCVSEPL